jgi:hypothetical protein
MSPSAQPVPNWTRALARSKRDLRGTDCRVVITDPVEYSPVMANVPSRTTMNSTAIIV